MASVMEQLQAIRSAGGERRTQGLSDEAICQFVQRDADLVEAVGVLLLPGTLYGDRFNAFRIGFGRKNLPQALDRLEQYLRQNA